MAHIHEKIDWTVGAYIVHKNKVLIRLHEKYHMWIHVGGHVELDEDPITAVIRECKEEVGLDVKIYDPNQNPEKMEPNERYLSNPMHMNIHYIDMGKSKHQHLDLIYYATSETDTVVPENVADKWVWLTKEEVREHPNMTPKIKSYALGALAALHI
jgi:8-oxo-dGTP pyrophosphatase MutT (NUDIX family)